MTARVWGVTTVAALMAVSVVMAQDMPASPTGKAQVQLGGQYVKGEKSTSYQGGKWMEITYSRPILRGRTNIFGSGATYGKDLLAGAPVWRAGADVSTRLRTEAGLMINGKHISPGEYSVFIDLKEGSWTLILSSWDAQKTYDQKNKAALWGSYGYTPDKDVARAPMKLMKSTVSVEQLTWGFINITKSGGEIAIWWDKEFATVPFQIM